MCVLLTGCQTSVLRETPQPPAPSSLTAVGAPAASAPTVPSTTVPATPHTAGASPAAVGSPVSSASPVVNAPSPAPPPARALISCGYGPTSRIAEAQNRAVKEASALIASQRWPGVYWTLNDSGNAPSVFALDEEGQARGMFRVDGAENEDWEALQLGPDGNGGTALYIGDIGDNDAERKELTIYRIPEPEPSGPEARAASDRRLEAEAFKIAYPTGARDAETLLVHPQTGEILLLSKEQVGRTTVYRLPQPLDARRTNRMEKVVDIDLGAVGVKADVLVDGTVSADARRVTIRTYGSALEYDVPPGATLASIWGQTPRVSKLDDGPQGESITYRVDGSALISIGEGSPARIYASPRSC
jgi:hypothetical protein